jgi:hypothetical protein
MLYLIENRNQDKVNLKKLLDAIKPLIMFTSPSISALEMLRPYAETGPVQDYSAIMELSAPFSRPEAGPKIFNEAALAHYSLPRQEGSAPRMNESAEEVFHRVSRWFRVWRPYYDQTPTVPVVIFVDPTVFPVVHSVIDAESPGRLVVERGTYGSIIVYNNDGWSIETLKQLQ